MGSRSAPGAQVYAHALTHDANSSTASSRIAGPALPALWPSTIPYRDPKPARRSNRVQGKRLPNTGRTVALRYNAQCMSTNKGFWLTIVLAGLSVPVVAMAQTAKDDIKRAGQDIKKAGKATGSAAKKTGSATKKTVKKGVNKAAEKTEEGANKVEQKTR